LKAGVGALTAGVGAGVLKAGVGALNVEAEADVAGILRPEAGTLRLGAGTLGPGAEANTGAELGIGVGAGKLGLVAGAEANTGAEAGMGAGPGIFLFSIIFVISAFSPSSISLYFAFKFSRSVLALATTPDCAVLSLLNAK
jgi:hypothetical protein